MLNSFSEFRDYAQKLNNAPVAMIMAGARNFNPDFNEVTGALTEEFVDRTSAFLKNCIKAPNY